MSAAGRRSDPMLPQPPATDRPNRSWMCGKLGASHSCYSGPNAAGRCPLRDVCRPQRTWQGKRRPFLVLATLLAIVTISIASFTTTGYSLIKPGELTTSHAQILAGSLDSERCATCHPSASGSLVNWFLTASTGVAEQGHANVDQTDRCLNCHHSLAKPDVARSAHNVTGQSRDLIRLASTSLRDPSKHSGPRTSINQDDIACGVCHQEHHGAGANLMLVSDAKCQSCHAASFNQFSIDHPDWAEWPYGNGGEIAFNHATHASKHFPASASRSIEASFRCNLCHEQTANNEITRTRSYERACATCHDEALKISSAEGIELVSLPMLPQNLAASQKDWPIRATGLIDGSVAPLTELLSRGDAVVSRAIGELPSREFAQLDVNNAKHRAAALAIASGSQSMLADIAGRGHEAIRQRAIDAGVHPDTLNEFLRSLPPQLIADTLADWFRASVNTVHEEIAESIPSPSDQVLAGDDLLAADASTDLLEVNDLLTIDPLLTEPLSLEAMAPTTSDDENHSKRFDAAKMLTSGGWYRDDLWLSIRYRGVSHSDATLRATIEMLACLSPEDPVRVRMLAAVAIQSCIQCHPTAVDAKPQWTATALVGRRDSFTRFSHGPHVNIASLADCTQCHRVGSPQATRSDTPQVNLAGFKSDSGIVSDFEPLNRSLCVGCHTTQAAGDACTTCHRYHVQFSHDEKP